MIEKPCGNSCPATCDNPKPICTRQCEEGTHCACPKNKPIKHDGKCITLDQCEGESLQKKFDGHRLKKVS